MQWVYGRPEMESYEEFCLRSLAALQNKRKYKKGTCEPPCSLKAGSLIRVHGRAVLSPLLSTEQRAEMCDYRRRAVQLESDRKNKQRSKILAQALYILDQAQASFVESAHTESEETDQLLVPKAAAVTGYTLVTDSPELTRGSGFELQTNDRPASPLTDTTKEVKLEQEQEEEEEEDISLDSLLKRSREYVKREQSQQRSNVGTPPPDAASDKENSPTADAGVEFGFSLHHSPVGPAQPLHEPSPRASGCLSPAPPERYARLPSPQSSISPRAQKRRPRPVSTGNIHISFPIGPAEPIPRSPGRSGEGAAASDRGATHSPGQRCSVGGPSSHCGTTPEHEAYGPVSASVLGSVGPRDHLAAGFRRRCHTLDDQLHSFRPGAEHIDRSQERIPRFMAGVAWAAPARRTPAAALNQSYEVENPPASLTRPRVSPDSTQVPVMMRPDDLQGLKNGRISVKATDAQTSKKEETQRRAQALEDMQRRLEEEHALQMSLLLAEQEKEQQRLRLELEETERRLKGKRCARPLSADACDWNHTFVTDSCPLMSPSCPRLSPAHTPSPGHSIGFISPVSPSGSSPSVQPPVYLWGPSRAAGKPRARLSQVLTAEQHRALCRIGALVRGFLTRRLLKTDKVKQLRQTVGDTQEFIRSFQIEASQKKCSYSAQDQSLQERVGAQLRAALYDVHDIFFEMPLRDRLSLLQQDRELRAERKLRDMEKTKCPKERAVLSAATQRSLDRKKKVSESPAQARKMQQKPKSPTTNRVLKPSQGQNSPVQAQLNRQGSWYRKTPEERVKRSDNLKKQHSLG